MGKGRDGKRWILQTAPGSNGLPLSSFLGPGPPSPKSPADHVPVDEWGCIPEDYLYTTCVQLRMHFLLETVRPGACVCRPVLKGLYLSQ